MESNEVLVPVLVLDKPGVDRLHQMAPDLFVKTPNAQNTKLLKSLVVRGLVAKDFQVFEDGKEQRIQRATFETASGLDGRPGVGEGKWGEAVSTDIRTVVDEPAWPNYVIAYDRPPSPEGSCHHVAVKVDRPDSLVYVRDEYCNESSALSDPLKGTKLGRQMETDVNSVRKGNINLSAMAFPFFGESEAIYTDIVLAFPRRAVKLEGEECGRPPKVAILGIVYAKDGNTLARFSDVTSLGFGFGSESLPSLLPSNVASCVLSNPSQYETGLNLAPGEYDLRVVFRDGKKFGRAEIPINVEKHSWSQLAIGGIALAKKYQQTPTGQDNDAAKEGYKPLVSRGFEVSPTANTRFKKSEPFYFYFEVYEQERASPAKAVEAHLRIVDAKRGQVVKDLQPVDARSYANPGNPVVPIGGGIDISGLPSGSYQLQAQATDSSGQSTAWRSVDFSID